MVVIWYILWSQSLVKHLLLYYWKELFCIGHFNLPLSLSLSLSLYIYIYIYIYRAGSSYYNGNFNAINYKLEIFVAIDCKNNTLLRPHSITHLATSTITSLTTLILSLSQLQMVSSLSNANCEWTDYNGNCICAHKPSKLIRNWGIIWRLITKLNSNTSNVNSHSRPNLLSEKTIRRIATTLITKK